jgi:hypothetical protein
VLGTPEAGEVAGEITFIRQSGTRLLGSYGEDPLSFEEIDNLGGRCDPVAGVERVVSGAAEDARGEGAELGAVQRDHREHLLLNDPCSTTCRSAAIRFQTGATASPRYN